MAAMRITPAAALFAAALTATAVSATPTATAATPPRAALGHGVVRGFASGDFVYLNALEQTTGTHLAQISLSQSAAAVASGTLQKTDSLDQLVFANSTSGRSSYGHASGVSLNLGQGAKSKPQAQLTAADVASPPRKAASTNLVKVPADPLAAATVQPDTAVANTTSRNDFCVIGKPLSQGVAAIADAHVVKISKSESLIDAPGEVKESSTEQLVPNGHAGTLGLASYSTLNTATLTLFKGISGAATTFKVVNPVTLASIAGGWSGTGKVTYGDAKGKTPVLTIKNGSNSQTLTLDQLIGGGATIDFDGLLKVHIGLKPYVKKVAADGTSTKALADLVSIQFVGNPSKSGGSVGGPLGPVLTSVLNPVITALHPIASQIDSALKAAGLKKGVDFRVGHFETSAIVPLHGITCGLPVRKTVDTDQVRPGDHFTYTITVSDPYDCTLKHVKVVDTIVTDAGVKYTVGATNPTADVVTPPKLVWNDIGDITTGHSKSLTVSVSVDKDSLAGLFVDHAKATASCGTGGANGGTVVLTGHDTLPEPHVTTKLLAETGMSPWLPVTAALLVLAGVGVVALRRRAS
jgi:uncharacterized repeat protein (TIGR01451 family)